MNNGIVFTISSIQKGSEILKTLKDLKDITAYFMTVKKPRILLGE